jgi:hypothetical protein
VDIDSLLNAWFVSATEPYFIRSSTRHENFIAAVERTTGHHVSELSSGYSFLRPDRETRRLANDLSSYETAKYKISIVPTSSDGTLRFHLGEQITIRWQAPYLHSRRDWIGIYRVTISLVMVIISGSYFAIGGSQ